MSLSQVMHSEQRRCRILEKQFDVTITITNSLLVTMDFNLFGQQYNFEVRGMGPRGFKKFVRIFLAAQDGSRAQEFGELVPDEDDEDELVPHFNSQQRNNIIVQFCCDVLACVDAIVTTHQRSCIDYAIWFRQRKYDELVAANRHERTYQLEVTMMACHFIVHEDFMRPNARYDLVLFEQR